MTTAPNTLIVKGEPVEVRPGRTLNVTVHPGGERAGATVFLCHGAGGNQNQWRNQWLLLTGLGYRVVAWDFPGHGQTKGKRQTQVYAGSEFLQDYLAILAKYATGRNILVGHSYGSRLTLAVLQALRAEGRLSLVERAMLLGPPPAVRTLPVGGPLAKWPLPLLALIRPMLSKGFRQLAWHSSADPALVAYEDDLTRHNSLFMMRSLMAQSAALDVDSLGLLDLPILVLAGASDGLTPAAGAEALAGLLPQASLTVLPQCAHQIMLEKPAETNALLLEFIGG
ncbi:MAG: alpha/beta hydrolase [Caulobacteraceae bacterium]|nr:alpha/beta hydrolase [Caulobacteraceae bacterium]